MEEEHEDEDKDDDGSLRSRINVSNNKSGCTSSKAAGLV